MLAKDEKHLLKIAASLEAYSNHPIAAAIEKCYDNELIEGLIIEEVAGRGIIGRVGEKTYAAGNHSLMQDIEVDCGQFDSTDTVVYVAEDNAFLGVIFIGDNIKEGANGTIARLIMMNKGVVMLTGDNQITAEKVGKVVGVDKVIAGVSPVQKEAAVRGLKNEGFVIMVGDGINDAWLAVISFNKQSFRRFKSVLQARIWQ